MQGLEQAGFDLKDVSVLARDHVVEQQVKSDRPLPEVVASIGTGAVGGGLVGGLLGLLATLGVIAIPGIGPALVAGGLAAALGISAGGAGVGAAVGGILGAMTALSIPEEEAQIYAEAVKRGHILVAVNAEGSRVAQANDILRGAHALDTSSLRSEWQKEGWQYFEERDK